ncbi:efflux RND transporter periplasmic adaptor subunit [Vibrio sp. Of7-15]|uniref:efflux RND transporter periplasmic adaptor subunit n=1 Tax=Vibrio sp. Of7-15 TaxID=2724879 RepID=UPI001EF2494A|nr:efflux RND transporter periplasmic adaptor subunit [Vibrio sp. Of7-15]MCG7495539.1 efflux RND transporter periplasmic adaptor subunit [Vibrio sp. Of7-15]
MKLKPIYVALLGVAVLAGCSESESNKSSPPLPLVEATSVVVSQYKPSKSYVGRTEALEDVGITAQVSGYLLERYFVEGELVEKGDRLFQIDPASYKAKVTSAEAAISQAKANLSVANLELERGEGLLPKGSISQSNYDGLVANQLEATAQLKSAQAQLTAAKVDLSRTLITAPISGRISESKVSIGDLVSSSSGVLTTLVSLDPIFTSFNLSEKERLNFGLDRVGTESDFSDVAVSLKLGNGDVYSHSGDIAYVSNRIDVDTGTIALKALFPNPEHQLLPGQYTQVVLQQNEALETLVIPRRAVQTDLEGDFVMVLTGDNVAERRNVELGQQTSKGIIIRSGITAEDNIITSGLQRVRNGMPVRLSEPKQ